MAVAAGGGTELSQKDKGKQGQCRAGWGRNEEAFQGKSFQLGRFSAVQQGIRVQCSRISGVRRAADPAGFSAQCKHICSVPWRSEMNLVISDPCDVSVAQSPPHHPMCAFFFPFLMFSLPTFPSAAECIRDVFAGCASSPALHQTFTWLLVLMPLLLSVWPLISKFSSLKYHLKQNTMTRSLFLVFTTPPNPSQASAAAAWQVSLPFSNRCI